MEGIEKVEYEDMSYVLDMDTIINEIEEAFFQIHPNKALVPDGMHAFSRNLEYCWPRN